MSVAEGFALRLREMREKAGLSRPQLADAAGVSDRAITQWERREREPSWSNVLALAKALGVDCSAFTGPPAIADEPRPVGRPKKTQPQSRRKRTSKKKT